MWVNKRFGLSGLTLQVISLVLFGLLLIRQGPVADHPVRELLFRVSVGILLASAPLALIGLFADKKNGLALIALILAVPLLVLMGMLQGLLLSLIVFAVIRAKRRTYFAKDRRMIVRADSLIPVEQSFVQSLPGEEQWIRSRLRSLGCSPCTGAIRSDADTIPKIIAELVSFRSSERANRVIDHDQEGSMEIKKREGYF
jgi:hypothetical protein